ncbi:Hypothetical protein PP7435_CHR1-0591 [Komagataella phaffii CBS 7435]|uniref:Uncharacterized protein n=2 Tax=Komagataella phaffii TaxID=460519 RepID=C4QWM3_KOMPG|nr:uncharacterized protein PAS_chr1-1_0488 [Komagataella phaffii GS115]AOA60643.1 GQ67_02856T0 [Komagataella phaffii]KAI0464965.1 hypothetical protein LJB42_000181 [Komagataella kurtzmanii]CAH2446377.1 Hypothetical protein BQ9382_C1-3040 [Komagataella phaffii CBS 7435]AOA66792.1 GQ68_02391T0 [Komagataella phaffii GS115]CAY67646.1 hypothetical protein PAS_chr1-1_0488 [Komagataella phaffii GS115]
MHGAYFQKNSKYELPQPYHLKPVKKHQIDKLPKNVFNTNRKKLMAYTLILMILALFVFYSRSPKDVALVLDDDNQDDILDELLAQKEKALELEQNADPLKPPNNEGN